MLVGVDIGGTKTHVRAEDAAGHVHDHIAPTPDWCIGGLFGDEGNPRRLVDLIRTVTDGTDPVALAIGAHGVDTPASEAQLEEQLRRVQTGSVTVSNDAELLVPATGHDQGIAVIAGTGSIIVGTFADRPSIVAGGHGWLFGDPGSAPGLVREAAKAVLARRDTGQPIELLGERLIEHYGVDDETELLYRLSVAPTMDLWGDAAPVVFTAADDGSELARLVIDGAARRLADSIQLVCERGASDEVIVCAGGVITHQPRLFDALTEHVRTERPDADVQLYTDPPVAGALARARRLAEQTRRPSA